MILEVKSVEPVYGKTYRPGYIGFQFQDDSVVSDGIAYFTRWDKLSNFPVTHTFIVSCKNECIEAHLENGVQCSTLDERFADPHCHVVFRKPIGLTIDIGSSIVYAAASQLGDKYDKSLIIAQAFEGTFTGRVLRKMYGAKLEKILNRLFDHTDRWICSELASYALDEQPEYHDKGCLLKPNGMVSPQELFEDRVLFQDWKQGE